MKKYKKIKNEKKMEKYLKRNPIKKRDHTLKKFFHSWFSIYYLQEVIKNPHPWPDSNRRPLD